MRMPVFLVLFLPFCARNVGLLFGGIILLIKLACINTFYSAVDFFLGL